MLSRFRNSEQQKMRDFYDQTQERKTAGRRDLKQPTKRRAKTEATPAWYYQVGAIALTVLVVFGSMAFIQGFSQFFVNTSGAVRNGTEDPARFFQMYALTRYYPILLMVAPFIWWYANHRLRAIWLNNNAMFLTEDIEEYDNDAYVQTPVHIVRNFDAAPDAGLGFDGHVSAIVSHMMIDNKGINKVDMPQLDPNIPGQVLRDEDGNVLTKKMEMFDRQFGVELFNFSNVSSHHQHWYDATQYDHNPESSREEQKIGNMRQGFFGQKEHDTLADYINEEFYPLDTEVQRPAGVYFYDSRPVNTILIAITRGLIAQFVW